MNEMLIGQLKHFRTPKTTIKKSPILTFSDGSEFLIVTVCTYRSTLYNPKNSIVHRITFMQLLIHKIKQQL